MRQTIFASLQGKDEAWTEGCPDESSVGKWLFISLLWQNLKDEGCFWEIPWMGAFSGRMLKKQGWFSFSFSG
ncbi:hypothetical protein [Paraprevotella clara]|uniref:hypothetical protein n=1 Tax=Paraprevotella clara TaxID=454154 RepID=UPI002676FD3D|nr:hypothetical protein [Paraprevotella clara]